MGFKKGHKINVGRVVSEETRRRIAAPQTLPKLEKVCQQCSSNFEVPPYREKQKHCGKDCAYKARVGRTSWNKGLKGYRAGEKHPWMPKGEAHWSYKKDRSSLKTARKQAYDYTYKVWMKQVKDRDSWKCRINNQDCSGRLESHHILTWEEFPELRYEVSNGITLCHYHHPRKREDEKRLAPVFQQMVLSI